MSYIVTNKWLRAGYGEPLRAYFAEQGALEQIVDFGHAPIFPDADVFPCIVVLEKPSAAEQTERQVQLTEFPREALHRVELGRYVAEHHITVPHSRFGRAAWNLETSAVDDLLAKIRRVGVPLAEFAGVKPYYGIKTGLNEAFLIDTPTRDRLVAADSKSAEVIKPYLRGQDIRRWSSEWPGLWMVFTRRGINIEAYPAVLAHLLRFRERLEPRPSDWPGGVWPGRKPGSYAWYEIQDSIDYWTLFDKPKLIYQEIQTYPSYSLDNTGYLTNNKCFVLPVNDIYILGVLNSPLMWWHNWRYLPHMINDTLTPLGVLMEKLPIALPGEEGRAEIEQAAQQLIAITRADQQARANMLDWLRTEFEIPVPGQKLEEFAALDVDAFVDEVRKRLPKRASRLSPAALHDLRDAYSEQAVPVQARRQEALVLERRLSDLVNAAYGLTPDEVALLWSTAPPRMPLTE